MVLIVLCVCTFAVSGFYPSLSLAQSTDYSNVKFKKIQKMLDKAYKNNWFQGSVFVSQGGEIVYTGSVGFANREFEIKNKPSTVFSIGSMTKQFTAALIMTLVEDKSVGLDDSIVKYIPYYETSCPQFAAITIREALEMTTNIEDYSNYWDFMSFNRLPVNPVGFITTYACQKIENKVGKEFSYSDTNYFLLGAVIEAVTGMTYADYLDQKIVKPLKLSNTGYFDQVSVVPRAANGYVSDRSGYAMAPIVSYPVAYAAGAMYSTTSDMQRWLTSLLANKLFPAEITRQMTTGYHHTAGFISQIYPGSKYGFGLVVQEMNVKGKSLKLVGHGGIINGFLAQDWAVNTGTQEQANWDAYVTVLGNVQNDCFSSAWISSNIISILYGESKMEPPERFKPFCKK